MPVDLFLLHHYKVVLSVHLFLTRKATTEDLKSRFLSTMLGISERPHLRIRACLTCSHLCFAIA
jgi:Trp operon repressor